jgi:hypothetical protein
VTRERMERPLFECMIVPELNPPGAAHKPGERRAASFSRRWDGRVAIPEN